MKHAHILAKRVDENNNEDANGLYIRFYRDFKTQEGRRQVISGYWMTPLGIDLDELIGGFCYVHTIASTEPSEKVMRIIGHCGPYDLRMPDDEFERWARFREDVTRDRLQGEGKIALILNYIPFSELSKEKRKWRWRGPKANQNPTSHISVVDCPPYPLYPHER